MADLVLIPEPPEGLREAALRGNLVLFIGAGASRLAGCPGWDEFANGALLQLIDKGQLTYSQFEQIRHLSPRIKLSIARNIATDTGTTIDYDDLLPTPKQPHAKGKRLYNGLFKLGRIFVTTNYDRWLDERIIEATISVTPADTPTKPTPTTMKVIHKVNDFLPAALTCMDCSPSRGDSPDVGSRSCTNCRMAGPNTVGIPPAEILLECSFIRRD